MSTPESSVSGSALNGLGGFALIAGPTGLAVMTVETRQKKGDDFGTQKRSSVEKSVRQAGWQAAGRSR